MRHRHCSFTQRSQRYCSEDGFGFVTPSTVDEGRFANDMEDIKDWYIRPYTKCKGRGTKIIHEYITGGNTDE